ncbi:MAG: ATP-binding protein [Leptolyngbya sp. RL_3_1]|nr:ATP-binding protein [Leptolyngbya sp. RL_3_1]
MSQILGDFVEAFPANHHVLELRFTLAMDQGKNPWNNQLLSAHFLADYLAALLPMEANTPAAEPAVKDIKGAIAYIANELLENAIKFHAEQTSNTVRLGGLVLSKPEATVVIFTTNTAAQEDAQKFQVFFQTLLASDLDELYIQQVEASTTEDNLGGSGLGFITIMNDYQAKVGCELTPLLAQPETVRVTTMAQLKIQCL